MLLLAERTLLLRGNAVGVIAALYVHPVWWVFGTVAVSVKEVLEADVESFIVFLNSFKLLLQLFRMFQNRKEVLENVFFHVEHR